MLVRYFSIFQKYSVTFWVLFSFTCLLMFGFAFYQSTTVLHLTNKFKLSIDASYQINGVFSAVAYLSCIISGYITQKYINSHAGLLIGFIFYICACLLTSVLSFNIFLLGLSFFSLGYGFIYTNTFFLLGKLYHLDDERREVGLRLPTWG